MIDGVTLIFALIMFCVIWFLIYKFKLIIAEKKKVKNIKEKIEKQEEIFFSGGDKIDLKKELGLALSKKDEEVEIKVSGKPKIGMSEAVAKIEIPKKKRFSFFKKKEKEEKEE